MTEIPAIERELLEAARRRYGTRPRPAWRSWRLLAPAAVALGLLAAAWVAVGTPAPRDIERPAVPPAADPPSVSPGGYARQRELLGVLRDRTAADDDRQVDAVVRGFRRHGPRAEAARLLGKAPSGGAFVLVPVERFRVLDRRRKTPRDSRIEQIPARDGLCLMRRGNQGGAGICGSTQALLSGSLTGAIAGQSYGIVPDGVLAVRPTPTSRKVPVHRNFYVYDYVRSAGWAQWCYADGSCRPTRPLIGSTGA